MPRKTKEQIDEEKDVEKKKSTNTNNTNVERTTTKKETKSTTKKTTVKKTSKKSTTGEEPKTSKKTTTKKTSSKKVATEEEPKTSKKTTTKKTSSKKATTEEEPKTSKKTTTKKASSKKATAKEEPKSTKKTTTKKASTKKKSKGTVLPTSVEYYDLPYKYNETVVKVLYQNPTTLFVYWEISDKDIENYKKMYGDKFFETTEPILTVYNNSMHYQFEIVINDFANSWYFNINNVECEYHVTLGRRPKSNRNYERDYIYITSSNNIESPNDRILFNTNADNSVYFKNTKNSTLRKVNLKSLIEQLNLNNNKFGYPLIKNISDLYKNIFRAENMFEFDLLSNPSSGNPSSGSRLSRIK